jgi:hypothetical protein
MPGSVMQIDAATRRNLELKRGLGNGVSASFHSASNSNDGA